MEGQLASAVPVAGNAQVLGIPNVSAKFQSVVAPDVGPVIHPLPLLLFFIERTIALVVTQRVTEVKAPSAVDKERRHSRSNRVEIQAGDARVLGRSRAQAVRVHEHTVTVEPETEVRQPGGIECIVKAAGDALVARARLAAEPESQVRPARLHPKGARRRFLKTGEAVPTKKMELFSLVLIGPDVEAVTVEDLLARPGEVLCGACGPRNVRPRDKL